MCSGEKCARTSVALFFVCICMQIFPELEASQTTVYATVGRMVALPCSINTNQCGTLHSVKWYRNLNRIYVFSHTGNIARAEGNATNRMKVEYLPNSVEAKLKIDPVETTDDDIYKCEITYLEVSENCDVVQIVNLETQVKPEAATITALGKHVTNSRLEPIAEELQLTILCETTPSKPAPTVTWYNGSQPFSWTKSESEALPNNTFTGRSRLNLTLSRGDLGARYECRVKNSAINESLVSWVEPDVLLRPEQLQLTGGDKSVVEGSIINLRCLVSGARPAATIAWRNNTEPVTDESLKINHPDDGGSIVTTVQKMDDGTFETESILTFTAYRWDSGKAFHCHAENEVHKQLHEVAMHSLTMLKVLFPPVITVRPLEINTNETGSILLCCSYVAYPETILQVTWVKDGENLTLSSPSDKYDGGNVSIPTLVINNVNRSDTGEYTCILRNEAGTSRSKDSIKVNVVYPPSVEVVMEPSTPVRAEDKGNVTLVCNVTSGNPASLDRVRWYLGPDQLKELPDCNYTDDGEDSSSHPLCYVDPSIMSLWRVDESFAGNYSCQGMNAAGWGPISEPQEVIVYYPPSPAKITYDPPIYKGKNATIKCTVDNPGRPDNITYMWFKDSHLVNEARSVWNITKAGLSDRKNITCIAKNAGGESIPAGIFLNVTAPPAFIQALNPYYAFVYDSKNISLTCRIECSPPCKIVWSEDSRIINTAQNPEYHVVEKNYEPDWRKGDFESVESTLYLNTSAWPGSRMNKLSTFAYSCHSQSSFKNELMSSTVIGFDYPPENVTVTGYQIEVTEGEDGQEIVCRGKGSPNLDYVWKRNDTADVVVKGNKLHLQKVTRDDGGIYTCEASNKYGKEEINVLVSVKYIRQCKIYVEEIQGNQELMCKAEGNPANMTYRWSLRNSNETVDNGMIRSDGSRSFLKLETGMETARIYECRANNSIGESDPCIKEVSGSVPWWNKEKLIIIIGAVIILIAVVILISILIILCCKRRRSNTKYTNPLEMEEREKRWW